MGQAVWTHLACPLMPAFHFWGPSTLTSDLSTHLVPLVSVCETLPGSVFSECYLFICPILAQSFHSDWRSCAQVKSCVSCGPYLNANYLCVHFFIHSFIPFVYFRKVWFGTSISVWSPPLISLSRITFSRLRLHVIVNCFYLCHLSFDLLLLYQKERVNILYLVSPSPVLLAMPCKC